ncbi:hypothetical protein [Saccharothrix sp. HUAS TT1]|uniref:hypothetical protein n=1 Tax=unclassified Saccharothrix TaxID=2593673 RepID=UPI00345BF5BE
MTRQDDRVVRVGGVGPVVGSVPERPWHVRARLRVLRNHTVAPWESAARTFRQGEVVVMGLSGKAGQAVRERTSWTSNPDVGVSPWLWPEDVEVLEVLEYQPPTWAEAALDPEAVTAALAPHHEGAAEAVAAWSAAGLHLAYEYLGLVLRTPAPDLGRIGYLRRDHHGRHTRPYEVVVADGGPWGPDTVELSVLPVDPVAAVERARREGGRRAR